MPQQLIQSDTLSQRRLEMLEGIEIISRHKLFQQVISAELGPEAAGILAEPVKNVERDSLAWYTDLPGAAVHFRDLNEEDRAFVLGEAASRAGQFAELAVRLKSSEVSNRVMAGDLLERVLSRVESRDLYLVGGRAVVAGWGLSSGPGRLPGPPEARPAAVLADPPPPPAGSSGRFRWLAFLLLGLLAGLLLAWLLTHLFLPGFWDLWLKRPIMDLPSYDLNQDREAQLRLELDRLKRLYAERRASCRPAPPAPEAPEPAPPEPEVPEPEVPEPEAPEPEPAESLTIPDDALEKNDFSFLGGCWASKADGLRSASTNQPIIYIYCFDENGRAGVRVEEKDAQGRRLDVCRTTAEAKADGPKLVIRQHGPALCGKGGGYSRATATCEQSPDKGVECRFEQDGSKLRPEAGFVRVEE